MSDVVKWACLACAMLLHTSCIQAQSNTEVASSSWIAEAMQACSPLPRYPGGGTGPFMMCQNARGDSTLRVVLNGRGEKVFVGVTWHLSAEGLRARFSALRGSLSREFGPPYRFCEDPTIATGHEWAARDTRFQLAVLPPDTLYLAAIAGPSRCAEKSE